MKRLTIFIFFYLILIGQANAQALELNSNIEYLQSTLNLTTSQIKQFTVLSDLADDHTSSIKIDVSSQEGLVLTLQSSNVTVKQGLNSSVNLLGTNGFAVSFARDGYMKAASNSFQFLPGNYSICYSLLSTEFVPEYKKCFDIEVISPYDLLLIYPFDEESVVEKYPVFTWTPIFLPGKNIQYQVKWVESDKEEMSETAFRMARSHFIINHLRNNNFPYKITAPKLKKDKNYFWQVTAFAGKQILDISEVWRFNFQSEKNEIANSTFFVDANRNYSNHPIGINSSRIGFVIDNYSKKHGKLVDIKDGYGNAIWSYEMSEEDNKIGQNSIEVDVDGLLLSNKVYTINFYGAHKSNSIKIFKAN